MNYWEKLFTSNVKVKDKTFKQHFDEYNKFINNSLEILPELGYPLLGREMEVSRLSKVMKRRMTPVACLIGQAGVGKTAIATEFVRQVNSNRLSKDEYLLISLDLGVLSALHISTLRAELAMIMNRLKQLETLAQFVLQKKNISIILFIDEVHTMLKIFGEGTKIGGDIMKKVLARPPIKVIAATTEKEYNSNIAVDEPLAERFKTIIINELPRPIIKDICRTWWKSGKHNLPLPSDEIFERIIQANHLYKPNRAEPRKTMDILEDLEVQCLEQNRAATNQDVDVIFEERYGIRLSFEFNPNEVLENLNKRVKGQHFAMLEWRRLIRAMAFNLDPMSNKPRATALLTGSTGVGKTESVKAIAEALYPKAPKNGMMFFNMPDYKQPQDEPLFRRLLGEKVLNNPNSIILLDEFEKGGKEIIDSMLAILDEGLIHYEIETLEGIREKRVASLRNAIVVCTTNAGQRVFRNDAKWSDRSNESNVIGRDVDEKTKAEALKLINEVKNELLSVGFKPEMLGRFNKIIPYRPLKEDVFLEIAKNHMLNEFEKFKLLKGKTVLLDPERDWDKDSFPYRANDVALYISMIKARVQDSDSGGARSIMRELDSNVYEPLKDVMIDNPDCNVFRVYVSKESSIYTSGVNSVTGGVIIEPVR